MYSTLLMRTRRERSTENSFFNSMLYLNGLAVVAQLVHRRRVVYEYIDNTVMKLQGSAVEPYWLADRLHLVDVVHRKMAFVKPNRPTKTRARTGIVGVRSGILHCHHLGTLGVTARCR